MLSELKSCTKCGESKPPTEFTRDKIRKDGLNPWCKLCTRANSARQDKKRDHAARYQYNKEVEKYRKKGSLVVREWHLLKLYNLTLAEFDQKLEDQGGCCKICKTANPGHKGKFVVDHNHSTGKIRGLLCHKCNTALGLLQDSPGILQRARNYLLSEGHYGQSL
jgi:hypothetical protein